MIKSVNVFIDGVKTNVNVPASYVDNFAGHRFTNKEQVEKAIMCATYANNFVISGILCKNADDVAKANFYNDELHRIIEDNNDDYLAAMYDAREDISDYEMSSCMCA
jgi:hypothetical protein